MNRRGLRSAPNRGPGGPCGAAALTLIVLAALPAGPARASSGPVSVEHRVKAAFLYKFAKFVEWPDLAGDVLEFCVLGDDAMERTLTETVAGKTVRGLNTRVRPPGPPGTWSGCRILFVGDDEVERFAEILDRVADGPVLTVGNRSAFTRQGGVINFLVEGGRVQFEINVGAARRAGLRLSSKLLDLARIVETSPRVAGAR